ncbi:MAG TPA: LysE family transporter [Polyangiaceae bacterium]|nr:LysE family transporter [Polyangiaceae bacterium]
MFIAFMLGFGIAFIGSMPMSGPVAVLIMTRALRRERTPALLVALGASLVEATYAGGIAFFLPLLLGKTRAVVLASLGLGCLVVTALGLLLLLRPAAVSKVADTSPRRGFLRGALSALLNPTLIATWTVAVSALSANGWLSPSLRSALTFALGVSLGSLAWFTLAVTAIGVWHRRITPALRAKVMSAMGAILVLSGVFLGVRFATQLTSKREPTAPRSIERAARFLNQHQ